MFTSGSLTAVIAIGAATGLVSTLGIYFEPRVSAKGLIVAAGTIRGAIVALLAALMVASPSTWLTLGGYGALFGGIVGLMVVLSKGEAARQHVRYILPPSIIAGAVSGVLIQLIAPM